MTWNKKNQQFALSCDIRRSTLELCQYILRRAKPGQVVEIEVDLRVANKWLGKHRPRGEYDRKTIKEALWQLDQKTNGWILVTKSYNWAIHKILVRPLEMVLQEKSQTGDKTPKFNSGNPIFSEDRKNRLALQQQQNISKLDSLLQKVGLNYTTDNLLKIWRMAGKSWSEITSAIEYMLYANSSQVEGVTKPHGWLINSLKYGWHKTFDLLYSVELPKFESVRDIADFVDDLCSRNQLRYET